MLLAKEKWKKERNKLKGKRKKNRHCFSQFELKLNMCKWTRKKVPQNKKVNFCDKNDVQCNFDPVILSVCMHVCVWTASPLKYYLFSSGNNKKRG